MNISNLQNGSTNHTEVKRCLKNEGRKLWTVSDVADKFDKVETWIHVNQSYATEILFICMHVTLSMPFCSLLKFPFSLINTVSFSAVKAESYPQTTGKWCCLKTLRFRDVCARYITLLLSVRSYLRKIVFDQTWSLLCGDQALLFAQSSLNVIPVARYRACKT